MTDDIVTRLRDVTEMNWDGEEVADPLMDEAADEIERLRGAIDLVIYAIENEGPVPKYHRDVMAFHVREWPTLWRAIYNLRKVRRG